MSNLSKIIVFLYICACTFYFAWGFTKLSSFYLIFINPKLYIKQISIAIGYFISVLALDSLVPDSLRKYHLVSIIFACGILILFSIVNLNIRRSNLGNLLFISQPIIKTTYFTIPFASGWIWSFSRILKYIADTTLSSTIDIEGMKINSYLWFSCTLFMFISITIHACIYYSWNKLEIRKQGIWLLADEVTWENIIDYSWKRDKNHDFLVIKQINGFNKEIENKDKIDSDDKEIVDRILSDKLRE
ncbi:MAG: hypothetical protein AAGF83_14940 [Cyanobacteria bacterium P01_G01_bin.67]